MIVATTVGRSESERSRAQIAGLLRNHQASLAHPDTAAANAVVSSSTASQDDGAVDGQPRRGDSRTRRTGHGPAVHASLSAFTSASRRSTSPDDGRSLNASPVAADQNETISIKRPFHFIFSLGPLDPCTGDQLRRPKCRRTASRVGR
jgi:hypothetical protein